MKTLINLTKLTLSLSFCLLLMGCPSPSDKTDKKKSELTDEKSEMKKADTKKKSEADKDHADYDYGGGGDNDTGKEGDKGDHTADK